MCNTSRKEVYTQRGSAVDPKESRESSSTEWKCNGCTFLNHPGFSFDFLLLSLVFSLTHIFYSSHLRCCTFVSETDYGHLLQICVTDLLQCQMCNALRKDVSKHLGDEVARFERQEGRLKKTLKFKKKEEET